MSEEGQLKSILMSMTKSMNKQMDSFTPLKNFSQKYKVQPSHVFVGVVIILLLLTITGVCQHIFVTLFATLYPAYMSFKALSKNEEEEKKKWLTFWIVFGLLTTLDTPLSLIFSFLPGYYAFKMLLYIWLFYPRTSGAAFVYKLIKPLLCRVQEQIHA